MEMISTAPSPRLVMIGARNAPALLIRELEPMTVLRTDVGKISMTYGQRTTKESSDCSDVSE